LVNHIEVKKGGLFIKHKELVISDEKDFWQGLETKVGKAPLFLFANLSDSFIVLSACKR
jgi:hypothetical protein